MFKVFQNDKPADSEGYPELKNWPSSIFKTKREAEAYAFIWAYPYDMETCMEIAPEMELGVSYDYSQGTDCNVMMKIVEVNVFHYKSVGDWGYLAKPLEEYLVSKNVKVLQMKEKFGEFRCYWRSDDETVISDEIEGAIDYVAYLCSVHEAVKNGDKL